MFQCNTALFLSNHILKAEILSSALQHSEEIIKGIYYDYSDGIVEGVATSVIGQSIIIHPGIIKYKGNFYYMNKIKRIPYYADEKRYYLRINFQEQRVLEEQISRLSEIYLTDEPEISLLEIELANFQVKKGENLKEDYTEFSDFNEQYNYLNIINTTYATIKHKTISPRITKLFATELLPIAVEPIDIIFVIECLKGNAVNRDFILTYIKKHKIKVHKPIDNFFLYSSLKQILEKIKNGNHFVKDEKKRHRIILD